MALTSRSNSASSPEASMGFAARPVASAEYIGGVLICHVFPVFFWCLHPLPEQFD